MLAWRPEILLWSGRRSGIWTELNDQDRDRPQSPQLLLARAVKRARGSLFWERLWPAVATLAVAIGLFLALSWAGLWIVLPPLARAVVLVILLIFIAVAGNPAAALAGAERS